MYGQPLRPEHGAPLRLVVPWKYAYKSIKRIAHIELLPHRPPTFWNSALPHEYPFDANVNPSVPHPRWSQQSEMIVGTGEPVQTQLFNGYGDFVARLYR
jgi:sulfoxide reductase catalytic subunit YedY